MTYAIVSGVVVSGTYLLLALSFTMLLRIADILNLAHGAVVVGGMYLTIMLVNDAGVPFALALPAGVLLGLLPAWALYVLLLRRARNEGHRPQIVYTTLLLSLLQVIYQIGFGTQLKALDIESAAWTVLGVAIRRESVIGFLVAVAVCVALFAVFRYTTLGKSVEVAGKYQQGAEVIGLPVQRLYALVYLTGIGMALLAGGLIVATAPVTPFLGVEYLVIAVVIAVAARLSFIGCVVASLLYGVGYQVLLELLDKPAKATIAIYGIFLLVIASTPLVDLLRRRGAELVRRARPAVEGV
jgi:branched-chain amino acid transport system permease protein